MTVRCHMGREEVLKYRIFKTDDGWYCVDWEAADGSGCPKCHAASNSLKCFVDEVLFDRSFGIRFTLDDADEPVEPDLRLELTAVGAV